MAKISPDMFWREKLACAYYFACPGIAYGIFTSRLPALKALTAANDAQIGLLLLFFGAASFCGLLCSRFLVERFSAKIITGVTSVGVSVMLIIAGLALNFYWLLGFGMLAGLSMGLCDVAMNAQGIIIENSHHHKCISFFHASYSLGGVTGSLSGSLFAAFNASPFWNFLIIQGAYLLLWHFAFKNLQAEKPIAKSVKNRDKAHLPVLLVVIGCLSMCCYISEGSVGEWGSILLHSVKGASQQVAALVFAMFSTTMVIGRFMGDGMRARFSDFQIVFTGSLLALISMLVVLIAHSPAICLIAYAFMGIGFAPIVPIFYSRAGSFPGVSPARASSAVSLLSYTGLLFAPPFIGFVAQKIGLDKALWFIALVICCIVAGSFWLRVKR